MNTRQLIIFVPAFVAGSHMAFAVPQSVAPPLQLGTTDGTAAAGNDSRITGAVQLGGSVDTNTASPPSATTPPKMSTLATRVVSVDDYGAAGDGVAYDDAAFTAACTLGGTSLYGTVVRVSKRYHLHAGWTQPENCHIVGSAATPDSAQGTSQANNIDTYGSALLVDSSSITRTVSSAGAASGDTTIPLTSTDGIALNQIVESFDGTTVVHDSAVTAFTANSITLHTALTAALAPGATLVTHSVGINQLAGAFLERVLVKKYGMAALPFASQAASRAEVASWAGGGAGVTMNGIGSGVRDIAIFGFNHGLFIPKGGRQLVDHVKLDDLNAFSITNIRDVVTVRDVEAWPFLSATGVGATNYENFRAGVGFFAGDNSSDFYAPNLLAFGYQTGFWVRNSPRVALIRAANDGYQNLVDPNNNPIYQIGFKISEGGSIDDSCVECSSFNSDDHVLVDITNAGTTTPQNSGFPIFTHMRVVNGTNGFHVVNGGLQAFYPSFRGGTTQPFRLDAGTKYFVSLYPESNSGPSTGDAYLVDGTVPLSRINKIGGQWTGYTDLLGNRLNLPTNIVGDTNVVGKVSQTFNGQVQQTWQATTAPTNQGMWRWTVSSIGTGFLQACTDDLTSCNSLFNAVRSGTTIGAVTWLGTHTFSKETAFVAAEDHAISTVTASFTFDATVQMRVADATSGNIVGTLPACTAAINGRDYTLVKADTSSNTVSFAPNGTDKVIGTNANLSVGTTQGSYITLRCNYSNGSGVSFGWWKH